MRVISGIARGRRLLSPEGLNTRPTSGKIKESIFSMIQGKIYNSTVLDLFSGTGALGIECISRGAASAALVDCDKKALDVIKKNVDNTGFNGRIKIYKSNAASFIKCNARQFLNEVSSDYYDIVFMDPPYGEDLTIQSIRLLIDEGVTGQDTIIVCEIDEEECIPDVIGKFKSFKEKVYGNTKIVIYCSL